MLTADLSIGKTLWKKLIKDLKTRGKGIRESGAFLLGNAKEMKITEFICYDDLDPHSLDSGIIVFEGDFYLDLWKMCREKGLQVLADVHTHPGDWTGQSSADKRHPMIVQTGHIALIIPNLACNRRQLLKGVGIHEYLGEKQWKIWDSNSDKFKIKEH